MVTLRQAAEQALEASASPTCNQALQVAARQALEAMKTIRPWEVVDYDPLEAAITALRAALMSVPDVAEQQEGGVCARCGGLVFDPVIPQKQQEPVAWGVMNDDGAIYDCITPEEHARCEGEYTVPLYAAPQPRREVELTDEEIDRALDAANVPELPAGYESVELEIARAVIEAYKAKQGEQT